MAHKARALVDEKMHIHAARATSQQPSQTNSKSVGSSASAASSTTAMPSYSQPTNVIALTKTFSPPSSCFENRLTQMPSPGYLIWVNEPVPAINHTVSGCYPTEFLSEYESVSSSVVGSSVVPVMSPLVCPPTHCTQYAGDDNYIACCPSGFQLHPPDTTVDSKRPAYGGTCYSDFSSGSTYPVTSYNTEGSTAMAVFTASTSGAQAYAHVIDGFALKAATAVGCSAVSSSLAHNSTSASSSSSAVAVLPLSSPSATSLSQPHASAGVIAGAVLGSLAFLALILTGILFLLRSIRRKRGPPRPTIEHLSHNASRHLDSAEIAEPTVTQYRASPATVLYEKDGTSTVRELVETPNHGQGRYEMHADDVPELDAGYRGDKGLSITEKQRMAAEDAAMMRRSQRDK